MSNHEIAQALRTIADYLDMDPTANPFRVRAFRKAALIVDNYPASIGELNLAELKALPGIGETIATNILEYSKTGQMSDLEKLKRKIPVDLESLTKISGIGPRIVKRLYLELGVKNVNGLKKVAEAGKIAKLVGFGTKSQQKILDSLRFAMTDENQRFRLDEALLIAQEYLDYLKKHDISLVKIVIAGSVRRRAETIGDIDLLAVSAQALRTIETFVSYPQVDKILNQGETKASVWLKNKIQVDLRVVQLNSFGSALQYFTGSKNHGIHLRKIALKKGYKLNEYGLFLKSTTKKVAGKSEKEIYQILISHYIEPEMREDEGEIELALKNQLPKLVKLNDIEGDWHTHTTFSDGLLTIDQLVAAAIKKGYRYIGISDHLNSPKIAHPVTPSRFQLYLDEGRKAKKEYQQQITVFIGGEVSIRPNGTLDFPEKLLKKLDYVIASPHSSFNQTEKEATARMLAAVKNPLVKIIGHPTGRLLGERKGLKFNTKKVFAACAEAKVALEINAHPTRLDLSYSLVKLAKTHGVKFVINTDAHSEKDLDLMPYGVWVARKAGLEAKDLTNVNDILKR